MNKTTPLILLAGLMPLLGACHLLPLLFGQSPPMAGNWSVEITYSGGGTSFACLTVADRRITESGNCGGTPDTIVHQPQATVNGDDVDIEVTVTLSIGATLRSVYDLTWQLDGTLIGTVEATLNSAPPVVSHVVWRRR